MYILPAKVVYEIASREIAFEAVRNAFIAAYQRTGKVFPVVIAHGRDERNIFSIKSGTMLREALTGFKIGTYWADNHTKGIPNHSTTTLLLDDETGALHAILSAGYLNCLRTAAANAVASSVLAREDSENLAVIGAGHQAIFEVRAVCAIRPIKKVLIWSRSQERANTAAKQLSDLEAKVEVSGTQNACENADIIITVTPSTEPLLESDWVKPGTHISAMGADKTGKQELPINLVVSAKLFADVPEQSRVIGEFEIAAKEYNDLKIDSIGAVLTNDIPGRINDSEITIFDSSGIALQDLFIAKSVLNIAKEKDTVQEVTF